MRNKQKAWRRPEVQRRWRTAAVSAALSMAAKVSNPKASRFFFDEAQRLSTCRVGRAVRDSYTTLRKAA